MMLSRKKSKLAWQQQDAAKSMATSKPNSSSGHASVNFSTLHGGITISSNGSTQAAEFEALKTILVREGYLRRVQDAASELHAAESSRAGQHRVAEIVAKVATHRGSDLRQNQPKADTGS